MEETATAPPEESRGGARLAAGAVELERRAEVVERLRGADRELARAAAERFDCIDTLRREAEAVNADIALVGGPDTARPDATRPDSVGARSRVWFTLSPDIQRRSVRAELAAASRISERAAETQLAMAESLMTELTATIEALRAGEISERHARMVWEHAIQVPEADRAEFETRALGAARRLSTARLAGKLRDIRERLHPETAAERHRAAVEARDLWVDPCADGTAILSVRHSAAKAIAAQNLIEQHARGLAGDPNDTRTLAQIRADLGVEFLLNGEIGDRKIIPTAHIVVPALSLSGNSEELAILDGYGPIDLITARKLRSDAECFTRLLTHPVTGTVLAVDKYRPTDEMRKWLGIRDEICRAPGCGRRAAYCELDHTLERAADSGATAFDNLAYLCVKHHKLKTLTGWRYRHLDRFGTLEWTTPLGEIYITEPAVRMRGAPHLADAVQQAVDDDEAPPDPLTVELSEPIDLPDEIWAEIEALLDADVAQF